MGLEMSDEDWTELRATYLAMCAKVDHQFGRVLEALRKKHIYEDTAVFFLQRSRRLYGRLRAGGKKYKIPLKIPSRAFP